MSDQSKTFEVVWRVENVLPWLQTRDDCLSSPQFLAETLANTRWKLWLSRKCHLSERHISFELVRDVEDDYSKPVDVKYELSFVASDGSTLKSKSCTTKFAPKTVSQELSVKDVEIREEEKEAYLPEGVLTVRCKLWKAWSSLSERGYCFMRSVIGKKCLTLNRTIDYSNIRCVKFLSPFSEINFISFDVEAQPNNLMLFQRTGVECKYFSSYYCKLFALTAEGVRLEIADRSKLVELLTSHKSCSFNLKYYYGYFDSDEFLKNGALTLQLEITYYPGIESEHIVYGHKYKKVTTESSDLENATTVNSEDPQSSPFDNLPVTRLDDKTCDMEKNESGDEDEYLDAAGKRYLSITLKEDLASLYKDRLFCDTKLRTDTETFPAHKCVLSARSPVFKEMFTTDMKEKAGECINLPDISSDTVRRMLQFLYTDCTGDLDMQSAKDLYIASDKYDIASLKVRCSSFIKKNLCAANVCEIIAFADMHQDKDLESAAHEFFLTNYKEVFGSDGWKYLLKNHGSLAHKSCI